MLAGRFATPLPSKLAAFALVAVVCAVVLSFAGAASASHVALTVSPGTTADLVGGVYLEVPISISCEDPTTSPPFTFVYAEDVTVSVTQKTSGRTLARGSGGFGYVDNSLFGGSTWGTPLTCDGIPHTYLVNVFPTSSPFHGGRAVVQASASIDLRDPNDPWSFNDLTFVDSGPLTMSIRGG